MPAPDLSPTADPITAAAHEALSAILPDLAALTGRPTTDADLLRRIRAQPWGGHYTRAAGFNVGIEQHGPTLYVGRTPAPWNRDADLTLRGPDLLAALRTVFTIPPAIPSAIAPTIPSATPAGAAGPAASAAPQSPSPSPHLAPEPPPSMPPEPAHPAPVAHTSTPAQLPLF